MKKSFILFFLSSTFYILSSALLIVPTSNAQATMESSYDAPLTNPDVPQNLHTYTQSVIIEIMAALSCQLTGVDPVNPNSQCLGVDPQTGKIGFVPSASISMDSTGSPQTSPVPNGSGGGGAIGVMGNLIGMTFNIPVSGSDHARYLASNFGFTKKTFAQANNQPQPDPGAVNNPNEGKACDTGAVDTCGPGLRCEADPSSLIQGAGICRSTFTPGVPGQPTQRAGGVLKGLGYEGLKPIQNLWVQFRNIVYLLFVLLFVIVGLAIMLRVRIDPRTVMTIQNQIPKIIIALILVTFSYAIAGFLIDMMYVVMYLVFEIFSKVISIQTYNPTVLQNSNPLNAVGGLDSIGKLAGNASLNVGDVIASLFDGTAGRVIAAILGGIIGSLGLFGGPLAFFTIPAGLAIGAVGGTKILGILATMIAFLIFAVALLVALFRLWFTLIKAYVYILIDVLLAPFWIAFGLFPGSPIGFGMWLRDIIANLSAFPTTLLMFLFAKVFIDQFAKASGGFVPPFIGNPGDVKGFGAIIGIGILLMTPEVVNIVKQVLKSPTVRYTAAIGQAIGAGTGVPVQTFRQGAALVTSGRISPTGEVYQGGFKWSGVIGRFFR